jgi:hypothetical protein
MNNKETFQGEPVQGAVNLIHLDEKPDNITSLPKMSEKFMRGSR